MLINYKGVPYPKADTLLRFAEPEVVLGQASPFLLQIWIWKIQTYIFSNMRRRGPSGRNLGYVNTVEMKIWARRIIGY